MYEGEKSALPKGPALPPKFRPVRREDRPTKPEALKIALAGLGSLLFHSVFHWEISFWLACLAGVALPGLFFVSIINALRYRTWPFVQAMVIIVVAVALIIPVILLGAVIREQIILFSLPGFERMTEELITKVPDYEHIDSMVLASGGKMESAHTPIVWRWLVGDPYVVRNKDGSVKVTYSTNDTGFIRKELIYDSTDRKTIRGKRIAPKVVYL